MIARADRLSALDGLRGAMAVAVAGYHMSMWAPWAPVGTSENTLLAALGLYSVQGFFVLSGLCFAHLYRGVVLRGQALAQFHVKRFFRIAPLYYLSLSLSLASGLAVGPPPSLAVLVENATLSFGFFHPNHSLVVGGWSIGVEYVFYAAFPALLWAVRRPAWLVLVTALLAVLSLYDTRALALAPPGERFHAYVALSNHAFLFGLGALIAELRRRVQLRLPDAALPALIVLVAAGLTRWLAPIGDHFELVTGPARIVGVALAVSLVTVAALSRDRAPTLVRVHRALGELSFGVYMLHRLVYAALYTLPGVEKLSLGVRVLLSLGATLIAARIAHRLVERPAIALGARIAASLARPVERLSEVRPDVRTSSAVAVRPAAKPP
jgi:exopolysaccharide production protein ExoZ